MSSRKTEKKRDRLSRIAKDEAVYQEDEVRLRQHALMNTDYLPIRIGKPPSKEAMVERSKERIREHQKVKGHETPGGPVVKHTREEWAQRVRDGNGIATYDSVRPQGEALVTHDEVAEHRIEDLVRLTETVAGSVVPRSNPVGPAAQDEASWEKFNKDGFTDP